MSVLDRGPIVPSAANATAQTCVDRLIGIGPVYSGDAAVTSAPSVVNRIVWPDREPVIVNSNASVNSLLPVENVTAPPRNCRLADPGV